jgi:membrane protease YdiL (CAAX protease family)
LLIGLTLYGGLSRSSAGRLALGLVLAPLTRILSLTLPFAIIPQLGWLPAISLPLLIAAGIAIRQLGLSRAELGLRQGNLLHQLMLAGSGFGFGALEYFILRPDMPSMPFSWAQAGLAILLLIVFTGFAEELFFRGILQAVAMPVLGRWSLIFTSLLFAAMHIGHLSALQVGFVFVVGLLFALLVRQGSSILGVALAHGLTNVTLFVIMPYLAQSASEDLIFYAAVALGGLSAVAVFAIMALVLPGQALPAVPPTNPPGQARLRALRRELGLSYSELSQRTGIPSRLLAEIEHGLRPCAPDQLALIASRLEVTL